MKNRCRECLGIPMPQIRMMLMTGAACFLTAVPLRAQEAVTPSMRRTLALEAGNWQPHSLNDEPRFDSFGAAGATPYVGAAVCFPVARDTGIRLSIGFWSLRDLSDKGSAPSLTLHPLEADIKYWLVPDQRLSAYVQYGLVLVWGVENETTPFGTRFRHARTGAGAVLGAGVDVAVSGAWALGAAFQYVYVRFREPLGGVEDFSGPKISGMLMYHF